MDVPTIANELHAQFRLELRAEVARVHARGSSGARARGRGRDTASAEAFATVRRKYAQLAGPVQPQPLQLSRLSSPIAPQPQQP